MSPCLDGALSPMAVCFSLSRIFTASGDGSWARPARFHICLLVISCYPNSCPSALGLFRFRLQSATELNLPSETLRPWRGSHQITRRCSAPVATTSQGYFFHPGTAPTGNAEPPAPPTALLLAGNPRPPPPGASFLENTWLLLHPPSHSYTADEGFGWIWSPSLSPAPIFPFSSHFLILNCSVSQQLPLGKRWGRQVYQKS